MDELVVTHTHTHTQSKSLYFIWKAEGALGWYARTKDADDPSIVEEPGGGGFKAAVSADEELFGFVIGKGGAGVSLRDLLCLLSEPALKGGPLARKTASKTDETRFPLGPITLLQLFGLATVATALYQLGKTGHKGPVRAAS